MLPTHTVYRAMRPCLPTPPCIRPPLDLCFNRPRQFHSDFPPPLLSQTNTFLSHLSYRNDINPAQAKNAANDQGNIGNQKQQECQQDANHSFLPDNQEGQDQQTNSQHQQERPSTNGEGTSDGNFANNYQHNGPTVNSRVLADGLAPATDVYSNLNRLCELFPDIHPAQLQRVFDECGRDFLRTIDNVLYARRLRKSLLAHMPKFRSAQRAQQGNNSGTSPQEQKSETQQSQEEKQPQQSNKSQKKIRTLNNNASKRSRVLAFNAPSPSSTKKSGITSPKNHQPILPSSGSKYQCIRKSPPPPNVFIHPFESSQQIGGAGDASLNRNAGYMISHKRPHTIHYGAPSSASANFTSPTATTSTDSPMFLTPLPPPPIRYHLSNGSFSPWCQRTHEQMTASPLRKQDEQQQRQQQSINADHPSVMQQSNGHCPVDHGETFHQGSEKDCDWTQMLKSILDPIESATNNSIMNAAPITPIGTCNETNQQKPAGDDGSCSYGVPAPNRFPTLIEAALAQESEQGATDNQNSMQEQKTESGNDGNQLEGSAKEVGLEDISRGREMQPTARFECEAENISSPAMRTRQSHRKQHESTPIDVKEPTEESAANLPNDEIPVVEVNEPDFSPVNQLVIDTDPWVQGEEITEEQADDSFGEIDVDNYGQLIEI